MNFVLTEEPLRLVQDDDRFRMEIFGFVYEGILQEIEGSIYREAMAALCTNGVLLAQEIVRLRRISGSGETARFDAQSILFQEFTEAVAPGLEGVTTFDTCKWTYDRVSTEQPEVPECQFPGIRTAHEGDGS